jgi:hypothetical protein
MFKIMKYRYLSHLIFALIIVSCSKKADQVVQVVQYGNQYFVGKTIDYSTNNPIENSRVFLERAKGYHAPTAFFITDGIIDSTDSNIHGAYEFKYLNNYIQNYSSMWVKKAGYIFIGYGPSAIYDTIYKERDTITNNFYLDKATQLRIHIKDVPPFQSSNDQIDVFSECKNPITGATHFAEVKSFRGSIDTVLIDEFSYKWSPAIKITWQLTTSTGIGNTSGVIVPSSINEFGTTDIQINF